MSYILWFEPSGETVKTETMAEAAVEILKHPFDDVWLERCGETEKECDACN